MLRRRQHPGMRMPNRDDPGEGKQNAHRYRKRLTTKLIGNQHPSPQIAAMRPQIPDIEQKATKVTKGETGRVECGRWRGRLSTLLTLRYLRFLLFRISLFSYIFPQVRFHNLKIDIIPLTQRLDQPNER